MPTINLTSDALIIPEASICTDFLPGTSSSPARELGFKSFQISPFKKYLTISDKIIISRKTTKVKSKTPPAVTGKDFHENLIRVQREKEKIEQEKEMQCLPW